MTRATLLIAVLTMAACASADSAGEVDCYPAENILTVAPTAIVRDDPVDITVEWTSELRISQPVTATLYAGPNDDIEVEIELLEVQDVEEPTYRATLLNPFGVGAPSGAGWVLAVGAFNDACLSPASATTAFELQ